MAVGGGSGAAASLEVEPLLEEARARAGLSDFGRGSWREALERLLASVREQAAPNAAGVAVLRMRLLDHLVNRLEIEDWVARHPEVRNQPLPQPLMLATLPRTGQTALGFILERDPANRSLLAWFAKHPIPPPGPGSHEGDPRIERERALTRARPGEVLEMHLYGAEEPDECHWLISNDFRAPHEIYSYRVPSYYAWVRDDPGIAETYRYYRLQLGLLEAADPGRRWVLKNSPHLLYMEHLHAVLPDAIFVQLHRDPRKVLHSNLKLATTLRRMGSDEVDLREVGQSILGLLGDYTDRLLRFRAAPGAPDFIDLRFRDFVADPLRAVEEIYERAGIGMSAEGRDAMAAWIRAHRRRELREPRPADLSAWGLEPQDVLRRFEPYIETFRVDLDSV